MLCVGLGPEAIHVSTAIVSCELVLLAHSLIVYLFSLFVCFEELESSSKLSDQILECARVVKLRPLLLFGVFTPLAL